jgi:hypothetical protein
VSTRKKHGNGQTNKRKTMKKTITIASAAVGLLFTLQPAFSQGTAFTYQGRLNTNGSPTSGSYDLSFNVYGTSAGGVPITTGLTNPAVAVVNGLFTTTLDFTSGGPLPGIFQGEDVWLEIGARPTGNTGAFQLLTTRQQLTPSPYAIYAGAAGLASSIATHAVSSLSIADGTVVRSLNGLSDSVNLSAGTGVSITPNGNSLQISATGGSGLWSANGNSAYYNSGRVGIGTANPTSALEIASQSDALKMSGNAPFLTFSDTYANAFSRIYGIGGGVSLIGSTYYSGNTAAYVQMDNGGNFRFGANATLAGSLGIGTTSPQSALHISGASDAARLTGFHPFLTLDDTAVGLYSRIQADGGGMDFMTEGAVTGSNPGGLLHLDGVGYVGIGTTSPSAKLEVVSTDAGIDGVHASSTSGKGVYGRSGVAGPTYAGVFGENSAVGGTAVIGNGLAANSAGVAGVADAAGSTGVYGRGDSIGVFGTSTGGKGVYGTCATAGPTHAGVFGESSAAGGTAIVGNALAINSAGVAGVADTAGSTGVYGRGNLWAGYFDGKVSVCTLTIRGGCDLAEPFQMSTQEIPKGAVVVIDEENAGQLKMSDSAYDSHVAGIVSGANGIKPGISLSQEGVIEGGQNVALSGRVYVLADASSGPIKPGDLLTTSNIPGHAMKVTDHVKAQGAILGKAMSSLKEGKGVVLVLVSLQ